jgi:integrase
MEMLEMRRRLERIDRRTPVGQRDYALPRVALQTAQRVQALADMRIGDLSWSGKQLLIHFPRTKGGESDVKKVETETSKSLATYLTLHCGERWLDHSEEPAWISYSHNASRGQKLSAQALEQIALKYLGTHPAPYHQQSP